MERGEKKKYKEASRSPFFMERGIEGVRCRVSVVKLLFWIF